MAVPAGRASTEMKAIMLIRLLVCGGRDFTDRAAAFAAIDRVHAERGVALLIHGAARGADTLAGEWAEARGVPVLAFHADWAGLGREGRADPQSTDA